MANAHNRSILRIAPTRTIAVNAKLRRVGNRRALRCIGGVIVRKKSLRVLLRKTQLKTAFAVLRACDKTLNGFSHQTTKDIVVFLRSRL